MVRHVMRIDAERPVAGRRRLLGAAGISALILLGCSSPPLDPVKDRPEIVRRLIKSLEWPPRAGLHEADYPEHKLALMGEDALPALSMAVRYGDNARVRERSAFILGRIFQRSRAPHAALAYLDALRESKDPAATRQLLVHAWMFRDRDGEILTFLHEAISTMEEVTPGMVIAAAAMTEVESLVPMTRVIARQKAEEKSEARDLAIRYLGRAGRMGRVDAAEFLVTCSLHGNPDVAAKAGSELFLIVGRLTPRTWREWWLDSGTSDRRRWLEVTFAATLGRFEVGNRDDVARLVDSVVPGEDREPEFWLLERILDRRFGYISTRDVFDPGVATMMIEEGNARAMDNLKAWWKENSPYLAFNPSRNGFEIDDAARRSGTPVPPKRP